MMTPRLVSASTPVAPTTAAIAPNAPIGAAHMIMARMRKTSRWMCSMPVRIGVARGPIACRANPASSATSSVWRTEPSVNADTRVAGMIPSRNAVVSLSPPLAAFGRGGVPQLGRELEPLNPGRRGCPR